MVASTVPTGRSCSNSPEAPDAAPGTWAMRASSSVVLISLASTATLAAVGSGCDGGVFTAAGGGLMPSDHPDAYVPWESIDAGCPPMAGSPKVTDLDAGGALWMCTRAACSDALIPCGSDCACNNAILSALNCTRKGGSVDDCFGLAYTLLGSQWGSLFSCLSLSGIECIQTDGAADDASFE
jgi:hypothetical protein